MAWLIYIIAILGVTGAVGWHLRRFYDTYTEMLGMMAGMTMGMLNGFVLGYAAAVVTGNMFWGNVFGILLGVIAGVYFGLPAGLMGALDGGMGGLMAGSMGAMLAIMIRYPAWALVWTAVLLSLAYLGGVIMLVALIERRAPEYAEWHLLARWFVQRGDAPGTAAGSGMVNYYEMFDIPVRASSSAIAAAYLAYVDHADAAARAVAEEALATLTSAPDRARYDRALAIASGRGECCPPPRRSTPVAASVTPAAPGSRLAAPAARARRPTAPARLQAQRPPAPRRTGTNWLTVTLAGGGLLVTILVIGILLNLSARALPTQLGSAAPPPAGATVAALGADGVQTLDLVVNGDTMSYRPSVIQVRQGVPVRFNLRTEGRDPGCGRLVTFKGLGIHGTATPGKVIPLEFTPQQAGTFEINCGMNMMQPGQLIVTQ